MWETVVVSAHLDDAVLSCYHALSPDTCVVTVLAGFPPPGTLGTWDAAGGATDSHTRIAERRDEDRRALLHSGAEAAHLDFHDREYVGLGVVPRPTIEAIASSLTELLRSATTVFAPSALSTNSTSLVRRWRRLRHSDHRLVRDSVLVVRPDATLYADLPYALSPDRGFSLPRDVDRGCRREREAELAPELVRQKLDSIRCYETQLDQLVRIFGDFVNARSLGREVWWEHELA